MYSPKRKKGNIAEEVTVSYLKNNGFTIKDQNYLKKWGEIDIVAEKYGKVHFIEVKSSTWGKNDGFWETEEKIDWKIELFSTKGGQAREIWEHVLSSNVSIDPVWNMTKKKKLRISRVIRTYLADRYREIEPDFQIDLVSVLLDFYRKTAYIKQIENILLEEV